MHSSPFSRDTLKSFPIPQIPDSPYCCKPTDLPYFLLPFSFEPSIVLVAKHLCSYYGINNMEDFLGTINNKDDQEAALHSMIMECEFRFCDHHKVEGCYSLYEDAYRELVAERAVAKELQQQLSAALQRAEAAESRIASIQEAKRVKRVKQKLQRRNGQGGAGASAPHIDSRS